MQLKEQLLAEHNKAQKDKIVAYIGNSQSRFDSLMVCFFSDDRILSSHTAWPMSYCGKVHPSILNKYINKMINHLRNNVHDAVKRNTLRVLQDIEIPKKLHAKTFTICLALIAANEPVAAKVIAMTIVANICCQHHQLIPEFKYIVESQLEHASAGFLNRAKKELKRLEKFSNIDSSLPDNQNILAGFKI